MNEDIITNYEQLAAERGTTLDQLARENERFDPALAAALRARAAGASVPDAEDVAEVVNESPDAEDGDGPDFATPPKGRRTIPAKTAGA